MVFLFQTAVPMDENNLLLLHAVYVAAAVSNVQTLEATLISRFYSSSIIISKKQEVQLRCSNITWLTESINGAPCHQLFQLLSTYFHVGFNLTMPISKSN